VINAGVWEEANQKVSRKFDIRNKISKI